MRLNENELKATAAVLFQLIPESDRPLAELAMLDLVKFGAGFAMEAADEFRDTELDARVDFSCATLQTGILCGEVRQCLRRLSERVAYRSLQEVPARG